MFTTYIPNIIHVYTIIHKSFSHHQGGNRDGKRVNCQVQTTQSKMKYVLSALYMNCHDCLYLK